MLIGRWRPEPTVLIVVAEIVGADTVTVRTADGVVRKPGMTARTAPTPWPRYRYATPPAPTVVGVLLLPAASITVSESAVAAVVTNVPTATLSLTKVTGIADAPNRSAS